MNGVYEFLEGNGATVIFVEDLEDSLHKEWLQCDKCISSQLSRVTYVEEGISIHYSH